MFIDRQWQLQRPKAGNFGEFSVDSTNVVGRGTVTTITEFAGQYLRGGLTLTPIYGDWIQTASANPMVHIELRCFEKSPGAHKILILE